MDQMTDAAGLSLSELLDCVRDGPEEGRFEVARRIFADLLIVAAWASAQPRAAMMSADVATSQRPAMRWTVMSCASCVAHTQQSSARMLL